MRENPVLYQMLQHEWIPNLQLFDNENRMQGDCPFCLTEGCIIDIDKKSHTFASKCGEIGKIADVIATGFKNLRRDLPIKNAVEYMAEGAGAEAEWLVQDFLPKGLTTELSAPPGTYKSMLALFIAMSVAGGHECFGKKTQQSEVYYFDKENMRPVMKPRLEMFGFSKGLHLWTLDNVPGPPLITDAKAFENIYMKIAKSGSLMVFDTLEEFHDKDENSNTEMKKVVGQFKRLNQAGATVLFLHHMGYDSKTDGPQNKSRGASSITGKGDLTWLCNWTNEEEHKIRLKRRKARFLMPMEYQLRLTGNQHFAYFMDISGKEEREPGEDG